MTTEIGKMITVNDFMKQRPDEPTFTQVLAEEHVAQGYKKLTMETFMREDFPVVLFCIYLDCEGEYAGNVFSDAVDEFNKLGDEV